MGYFIFSILGTLLIIGLIFFGIIRFIIYLIRGRKAKRPMESSNWYLQLALSKEDAFSQLYFLLGFGFLGVTLFTFNRNFGQPFTWQAIIFLMSLIMLSAAYYFKLVYPLAVGLMGTIIWWIAQGALWIADKNVQSIGLLSGLVLIFAILYVVGNCHEHKTEWKRSGTVYKILGIIGVFGLVFFLSSNIGLAMLQDTLKGAKSFYAVWQISLSLLILTASLVGSTVWALSKKLLSYAEAGVASGLGILFIIMAFFPSQSMFEADQSYFSSAGALSDAGVIWATVFNILTLLLLIGLILSGYRRKESWQVNLGAFMFFIFIFIKYFDWFYSFLDKSAFFIGAGILLFVVGWIMEKSRKKMLESIVIQNNQNV